MLNFCLGVEPSFHASTKTGVYWPIYQQRHSKWMQFAALERPLCMPFAVEIKGLCERVICEVGVCRSTHSLGGIPDGQT